MDIKITESSIKKGISSCYGELSSHIADIVNSQSLSIFCSNQGKNIEKGIDISNEKKGNKENIVFNNPSFGNSWNALIHEEDVEIKRMATLSRLGNIAAENAVYVNKMKKRFRVMNIVGKEEERQASDDEYSYYDEYDEYDENEYGDYDENEYDDYDDYDYDEYDEYDYDEEWKEDIKEIHVNSMKQ